MKKIAFLLVIMALSARAQDFIYVKDSTDYRKNLGVLIQKPLQGDYTLSNGQEFRNESSAPGLSRRLSREVHSPPWKDLNRYFPGLHLTIQSNIQGKPEKIYYSFTHMDTLTRANRYHTELIDIKDPNLHEDLKAGLLLALKEYRHLPPLLKSGLSLRFTSKDYKDYLASLPEDTKNINLENYQLTAVPQEIFRFKQIKTLNLKDNYISSINISKNDFPHLENLSLQGNLMNEKSGTFPEVKVLNLIDNEYTRFPPMDRKTKNILLATNYITHLRKKDLKRMKNLETLNLYLNRLSHLPKQIKRLQKVTELDLYRNSIHTLPKNLVKMKALKTLALSYNDIQILPENLGTLPQLEQLYAHHNRLISLPPLPKTLQLLDVGYNKLQDIEMQVQGLQKLKSLDVSNNQLKSSLEFLRNLPELEEVFLRDNAYTEEEFEKIRQFLSTKNVTVK